MKTQENILYAIRIGNKAIIGFLIIVFPVMERYGNCFTGLTANFLFFTLFSLLSIHIIYTRRTYNWNKADLFFTLFFLWQICRFFTSSVPTDITHLFWMLGCMLLYFWVRNAVCGKIILEAFFIAGIIQSVWGILQYLEILPAYHFYFRQTGSFNNPGLWGIYLVISTFCCFFLWVRQRKPIVKAFITGGFFIVLTGLVMAHSRAAWIALISGVVWSIFVSKRISFTGRVNKRTIVIGIVVSALVVAASRGMYLIRPESVDGRLLVYVVSWSLFKTAPWCGHGIGSFASMYMPQQALWFQSHPDSGFDMVAGNNYFAFNEYLNIACETGIVGLLLGAISIFYCFRYSYIQRRKSFPYSGICVLILVFGMFSYPFANTSIISVFFISAAMIANKISFGKCALYVPIVSRYFVLLILFVSMLIYYRQFRLRKTVELAFQEVRAGERAITDSFLVACSYRLNNSSDFVLYYAEELYLQSFYKEAIPMLERACLLRPNATIVNSLGLCYQKNKEYKKAIEAFRLAARMIPTRILPRFYLFSLYRECGEDDKAREVVREALSMQVKIVNTSVLRARHIMRTFLESNTTI